MGVGGEEDIDSTKQRYVKPFRLLTPPTPDALLLLL